MNGNLTPPAERDFPALRFEQRRHQLVSWMEANPQAPLRRPAHPRRWVAAALAVAAAAAAALVLTLQSTGGPRPHPGPSSAGRYIHLPPRVSTSERGGQQVAVVVLLRAARTAAQQPTVAVP